MVAYEVLLHVHFYVATCMPSLLSSAAFHWQGRHACKGVMLLKGTLP